MCFRTMNIRMAQSVEECAKAYQSATKLAQLFYFRNILPFFFPF